MRKASHQHHPALPGLSTARQSVEPLAEGIVKTSGYRKWNRMKDEDLVAHAKAFIAEKGIASRKGLRKADPGLHGVLRKRKLMEEVGLPELRRKAMDWARMGRDGLVAYAKRFIEENGITGRRELRDAESRLYDALKNRKLLDDIDLSDSHKNNIDWEGMGRDELVNLGKTFIADKRITGRCELHKADARLYYALNKRKLLDEIGLPDLKAGRRDWASMGRNELVAHAKTFKVEHGLTKRRRLEEADYGLYQALKKRCLLDEVFSDTESSNHKVAVDGVIEALGSFGDER